MCIEAGQYDPTDTSEKASPLYKCDFFESKEAGSALKSVLQKGNSQPWQDTMTQFLCNDGDENCVGEMDPEALLTPFL